MAEQDASTEHGQEEVGSLAIPVIWGVAAGLFAAVITRGVLPGGIVMVLALMVFGAVVLPSRRGRPAPRRRERRRKAKGVTGAPARRTPPRPPEAMTRAAMAAGSATPSLPAPAAEAVPEEAQASPSRRGSWLQQAQRFAFGGGTPAPDDNASARED